MPTPFELLRLADLVKLAADTAEECSRHNNNGDMVRIREICLRIKADAEELESVGREMDPSTSKRAN